MQPQDKIPLNILVVDDDPSMRRLLQAMLSKMGHEVVLAADGLEAWDKINSEPINLVISDWRMPNLDGVELCKRLRRANRSNYIYVVLITGKDLEDDVIVAMQAGADDFLTKPVKARELEVRIEAGQRVLALEESLHRKNHELESAYQALKTSQARIERDLQAAAEIQQDLLPKAPLKGYGIDVAWDFLPADELAGDIFNFFPLDDNLVGFYLADVSGHGVPAAMLSVHIAKSLSAEPRPDSLVRLSPEEMKDSADRSDSVSSVGDSDVNPKFYREPSEVATRLNHHFQGDDDSMLYFTMIYGVLDTQTGEGKLCQAGHPYPMVRRASGEVESLGSGGFPIGLMPDVSYEQIEFKLQPGDRLLMFSDGITECLDPLNEPFGETRLQDCFSSSGCAGVDESLALIKSSVVAWHRTTEEAPQLGDDASMLAIALK